MPISAFDLSHVMCLFDVCMLLLVFYTHSGILSEMVSVGYHLEFPINVPDIHVWHLVGVL